MHRSRIAATVGLLVLVSCSKSPTGPVGPFAGHWIGSDAYMTLDMTLNDNGGDISGSGSIYGSSIVGGTISIRVSGSNDSSSCELTVNAPPYTHFTVAGALLNDTSFAADLNSSGFSNYPLTMVKQAH